MATISKGNRKANPNQTKNGKVRIGNFSLAKLQELVEKTVSLNPFLIRSVI
jgi:TRAP-type C4-dicarboxylate transport system substrate-binding protein